MVNLTGKLEEVKALIEGVSKDAQQLLTVAQMASPIPQAILRRILERAEQAKTIFKSAEDDNGRDA